MRTHVVLALWIAQACGPAPVQIETEPVAPRHELALDLLQRLGEATSYAQAKRHQEATRAWGEAYLLFETHFESELRSQDPLEATRAEYLFGQLRHELEQSRGRPDDAHSAIEQLLEALVPEIAQ